MEGSASSEVGAFVQLLQGSGLVVGHAAGVLTVAPRGRGGPATTIELPEQLLVDYLDRLGRAHSPFDDDPHGVARGLLATQLADDLTADHGGGVNRIRRVALLDGDEGPTLVEERTDDPGPPPADGPHDDPVVFAAELRALAGFLRDHGLDVADDPDGATLRVGRGRDVTVELRPDRYRRHLDALEEELEAIGGDPRAHAWTSWCRRILHVLTHGAPPDLRRLSFVETPEGEVHLVADAVDDRPPEPRYEWSANPGR